MSQLASIDLRAIIPSQEDLESMGRRRCQQPSVFKTESKRPEWYFRARVDVLVGAGETRRKEETYYLGFCDEVGKRAAEKARNSILEQAINKPALMIQSQIKFTDVVAAYKRDYLPSLRRVSAVGYESKLRKAEKEFGDCRMCDITAQRVQAWANTLPASTRRKTVQHFNLLWKCARAWGYTQMASPAEFINLGAPPMLKEKFVLTPEQYQNLRAILPSVVADMVDVAASTGLRISEIRGLPVRAVDLANGVIRVEQRLDHLEIMDTTKSPKGRRLIPIGGLKDLFRRAVTGKLPNALVFEAGCYSALWGIVKATAGKVGCDAEGFGWHTFRRSHNTWLRKRGMGVEDRMEQMGHASEAVNGLYNIRDEDDFRRREELVMKLQADLMGTPAGPKQ